MKITAKIQTEPDTKITLEFSGLKAWKSAHKLALVLQDLNSGRMPRKLARRIETAFLEALDALPDAERVQFQNVSQTLKECLEICDSSLERSKSLQAELESE